MSSNYAAIKAKTGYATIQDALNAYKARRDPNAAWFCIELVKPMVEALVNLYEGYAISFSLGSMVSEDDLIQEAYAQLIKSLHEFEPPDYAKDDHVSCAKAWNRYANLVIKAPIRDAFAKSVNQVDPPNWATKIAGRINRATATLEAEAFMNGDLASNRQRPSALAIAKEAKLPPSKVKSFLAHGFDLLPQSYFVPIARNNSTDKLHYFEESDQAKATYTEDEHRLLGQYLQLLDETEQQVMSLRYGLDDQATTIKKTGEMLGLTPKQVRIIEARSLAKLRDYLVDEQSV